MNVQPSDPQGDGLVHFLLFIVNGLLVALLAVGGFVVNFYRHKVETLEKGQSELALAQKNLVSRDDLDKKFDQMREDRQRMHQDNLRSLEQIRNVIANGQTNTGNDIRAIHSRIDDVLDRSQS